MVAFTLSWDSVNTLFVRHADAEPSSDDFKRLLSVEGKRQASLAARALTEIDLSTYQVFVSPATRTVKTWEIFCELLNLPPSFVLDASLYSEDARYYLDLILANGQGNLVIVGHNPAISQALTELTKRQIGLKPAEWVLVNYSPFEMTAETIAHHSRAEN